MVKPYQLSLHIFRRDLRLEDNTALLSALEQSERVIPCFIFDKRQIEANDYKSDHCVAFMIKSLQELDAQLKNKNSHLYYFYGIAEEVMAELLEKEPIQAVFINRDYTPFSLARDKKIAAICEKKKIAFHCKADALLHEPEGIKKADGTPYTIFTPFFKNARLLNIAIPEKNTLENYYQKPIALENTTILQKLSSLHFPNLLVKGGRKEGITLLKKALNLTDYINIRNVPSLTGTSHLSAHHKFGTLSIREVYHAIVKYLGKEHALINELFWRDFFTHIAYHFPRVFQGAFQERYQSIKWSTNEIHLRAWCEGRTGFPIVDAGMRELNLTGYMHNRVRMIVASFLTKDLHMDWRIGEKYFAQQLVDYDPAVNNGNWQWAASTGCDAQPYFRIFNPWLQQEKFDADCLYIKKYVPELASLTPKAIHALAKQSTPQYPRPIVDHASASQRAKSLFKV